MNIPSVLRHLFAVIHYICHGTPRNHRSYQLPIARGCTHDGHAYPGMVNTLPVLVAVVIPVVDIRGLL